MSSAIWDYWYFFWQSSFQLVLSPAQCSSWCTLHISKQGDNIQPWPTPFPIWNQSVSPCSVVTVAFWPAYRFLKQQVRWSGNIHHKCIPMDVYVSLILNPRPFSIPISFLRVVPAPCLMHQTWTNRSSISHMVICMFRCYSPKSPHP